MRRAVLARHRNIQRSDPRRRAAAGPDKENRFACISDIAAWICGEIQIARCRRVQQVLWLVDALLAEIDRAEPLPTRSAITMRSRSPRRAARPTRLRAWRRSPISSTATAVRRIRISTAKRATPSRYRSPAMASPRRSSPAQWLRSSVVMVQSYTIRSPSSCRCLFDSDTLFRGPTDISAAARSPTAPRRATAQPILSPSTSCWRYLTEHPLGVLRSRPGRNLLSR